MRAFLTRTRTLVAAAALVAVGALAGLVISAALSGDRSEGAAGVSLPGQRAAPRSAQEFSPDAVRSERPSNTTVVATARASSIRVYRRASSKRPGRRLRARRVGARRLPLVFLTRSRKRGWVRVYLPTRPNLSSGWLRARDVTFAANPYRVTVKLRDHRLTLWRAGRAVMRARIGTGKARSPTPTGRYFVTDLLRPPNPRGFYGPYALGLSAHSTVYTSFAGGNGQVGIHGTNRPGALGKDVSAGCIRVRNRVITRLAKLLPLGTPVDISRA